MVKRIRSAALALGVCLAAAPSAHAAVDLGGPPVRAMTADESAAHAIWLLRAGLNVSALQCQFSPYLGTVRNYNQMLKQHQPEFLRAYQTLEKHFRRLDGKAGARAFDSFTTRIYNSFSALDAQRSFCAAAGEIGRETLSWSPGSLNGRAVTAVQRLRAALIAPPDPYRQYQLGYVPVPRIPDPCIDKRGKPIKRCNV
ncbi:hypothetical protein [Sphingosinicella soli]|uniref:Uncharacterized protein n=1 Tax=Sphingosinicella soli TaxID=333708 RepID=A0A7W7B439_9SPHN|nr:hypothetical protein [Sphingosinicella soli]MBB4633654.1 hypothetical protein [Sphingosinicella soli]